MSRSTSPISVQTRPKGTQPCPKQQRGPLPPWGSPPGTGAVSPAPQPRARAAPPALESSAPGSSLEESGLGARGCSQSPPAGNPTRGLPEWPLPPSRGGCIPFSPSHPEFWGRRRPCPPSAPHPEVTAPRLGWLGGAHQAIFNLPPGDFKAPVATQGGLSPPGPPHPAAAPVCTHTLPGSGGAP